MRSSLRFDTSALTPVALPPVEEARRAVDQLGKRLKGGQAYYRRRSRPNVNPDQDQHRCNRLLAALRPRDYALLEPHLQIAPIREGEFLHLPGDEIEQVYFLHRGIVSLMAISEDGNAIATASVGSEGGIGTIAGTGFVRAFTRAMVQAPGDRLKGRGSALAPRREQKRGGQRSPHPLSHGADVPSAANLVVQFAA